MKAIWKFELEIASTCTIGMPVGAKILCVQAQNEIGCIWAEIETTEMAMKDRVFRIYGTGHEIKGDNKYIGTFQICAGALVWHVFEEK